MLVCIVNAVIFIAALTLLCRCGYRIGYRDATHGRPSRIPVYGLDEDDRPDDPDRMP